MNNNEVTEWCPNCDHEVTMRWDIHADGYKTFCPYCGNVLMLCDECLHHMKGRTAASAIGMIKRAPASTTRE